MGLEKVAPKHIHEMEQTTAHLLRTMKITKLQHLPLYSVLQEFEKELEMGYRAQYSRINAGEQDS